MCLGGSTRYSIGWFRGARCRSDGPCIHRAAVITVYIQNPLHRTWRRIISDRAADYRIAGTTMPTMDECRRKAEECLRWADEAANDQQRETLLEIARLWTQMELSSAEPNGVDGAAQVSRFPKAPKSQAKSELGSKPSQGL